MRGRGRQESGRNEVALRKESGGEREKGCEKQAADGKCSERAAAIGNETGVYENAASLIIDALCSFF